MKEEKKVSATGMMRNNGAKLPVELVPAEADLIASAIYGFGRAKYAAHNWRKGGPWSEVIGCLKRHIAWFEVGEDNDPDSGFTHISNMLFNVNTLAAFWATGTGVDDRHKLTPEQLQHLHDKIDELAANMKAGIEKYENKKKEEAEVAKKHSWASKIDEVVAMDKRMNKPDPFAVPTPPEEKANWADERTEVEKALKQPPVELPKAVVG